MQYQNTVKASGTYWLNCGWNCFSALTTGGRTAGRNGLYRAFGRRLLHGTAGYVKTITKTKTKMILKTLKTLQ